MPANLLDKNPEKVPTPLPQPRAPLNVARPNPLPVREHAVTAERVMLAVLFADVSDSTRLYEQMGDTGAFGQIKDCMQTLTEIGRAHV